MFKYKVIRWLKKIVDILDSNDIVVTDIRLNQDRLLEKFNNFEVQVMLNLDTLIAEVTEVKSVEESAIVLLQKLAEEIAANSGDQAKVDELAANLKSATDALAAAIAANTPATPPVV